MPRSSQGIDPAWYRCVLLAATGLYGALSRRAAPVTAMVSAALLPQIVPISQLAHPVPPLLDFLHPCLLVTGVPLANFFLNMAVHVGE